MTWEEIVARLKQPEPSQPTHWQLPDAAHACEDGAADDPTSDQRSLVTCRNCLIGMLVGALRQR